MQRKYYFIPETFIGLVALILINIYFFKESTAFIGIHPHPYWIIILLIASRYGTLQGLFAGGMAAIIYIYFGSKSELINFSDFTFPHGGYNLPFFFMLVGGLLGEIRSIFKRRFNKLEEKYQETTNDLQDLGLLHAALSESKQELEKRIAYQSSTMLNLFERLNKMESLDPESLYSKIPELLEELLNVKSSSIYLIKNNKLQLYIRRGEKNKNGLSDTVELTYGMMGEVIKTKKIVTINQIYSEDDFAKFHKLDLIMSAPIKKKDDTIIGIINIEKIPFFDFNANTVRIFETISYWISIVVDKAIQFQQLKDRNIADEITGAYNYLYFQKRLSYEIARAKRFQTPLSLILLQVSKFEDMNDKEQKNVLVVLNWLFTYLLRETDIISKYKKDDTFAIILPHQNNSDAEIIINRLMNEINNYKFKPFEDRDELLSLKIGLSALQISEGNYQSLIETVEERLKYGGKRKESEFYSDLQYLLNMISSTDVEITNSE
ncbi:MAG: diguanylate cyclase domain-containing protein [bacterium]